MEESWKMRRKKIWIPSRRCVEHDGKFCDKLKNNWRKREKLNLYFINVLIFEDLFLSTCKQSNAHYCDNEQYFFYFAVLGKLKIEIAFCLQQ